MIGADESGSGAGLPGAGFWGKGDPKTSDTPPNTLVQRYIGPASHVRDDKTLPASAATNNGIFGQIPLSPCVHDACCLWLSFKTRRPRYAGVPRVGCNTLRDSTTRTTGRNPRSSLMLATTQCAALPRQALKPRMPKGFWGTYTKLVAHTGAAHRPNPFTPKPIELSHSAHRDIRQFLAVTTRRHRPDRHRQRRVLFVPM